MTECSPEPTPAALRDAALRYIARYASTEAGLRRVLTNRIDRWRARQDDIPQDTIARLRTAIDDVVAALVQAGLVNDGTFAEAKGTSLRREGRSGRASRAKLIAKGVSAELVKQALPDDPEADLAAAVMTARRRRLGAFGEGTQAAARDGSRDLAKLVRAGFSIGIAQRALAMDPEEAEALIRDARR
jgi:regulatory protein